MEWTADKPDKAGWYWMIPKAWEIWCNTPQVVRVFKIEDIHDRFYCLFLDENRQPVFVAKGTGHLWTTPTAVCNLDHWFLRIEEPTLPSSTFVPTRKEELPASI